MPDTCRICGAAKRYVKRNHSQFYDTHDCQPSGCPVATPRHTLADGTLCQDERHTER